MKISQVIAKISQEFKGLNIESYNLEAEVLLSFVLKKSREYLFAHLDKKVSFLNSLKLKSLVRKRKKGYSLAVLMREKEFYGRKFYVNKNVLVPRPETETMVSEIINYQFFHSTNSLQSDSGQAGQAIFNKYKKINIIDVGTGSGCIIITLVQEIKKSSKFLISNFQFQALDISNKALKVAKRNAKLHHVSDSVEFIKSDLLEELVKRGDKLDGLTVITANLPYLTPRQVDNSPTVQKEPRVALVAGDDGLLYYRRLFLQIAKIKQRTYNNEQKIILLCEIDESQVDGIRELIGEIIGEKNIKVEIKKDFQDFSRLAIISI